MGYEKRVNLDVRNLEDDLKKLAILKKEKLRGSSVYLEPGDCVCQMQPEEDGWVMVKTNNGEQGEIPITSIQKGSRLNKIRVEKNQKLRGSKIWLLPGDFVYQLTSEEDGWIRVKAMSGEEGEIPIQCTNIRKKSEWSQYTRGKMKRSYKPYDKPTSGQRELGWTLYAGDMIEVKQEQGDWAEVEHEKRKKGWIPIRYFDLL